MARRGSGSRPVFRVAVIAAIASVVALAGLPLFSGVAAAAGKFTTTTLTATQPAYTGEAIVLTATVTRGTFQPTGQVTFNIDGSLASCAGANPATVTPAATGSSAQCTLSAGLLASGDPYSISAVYGGDSTFAGSTGTLTKNIRLGPTTTTVSSSSNPSVTGQPLTFTATVVAASPAVGQPTGNVMFEITGGAGFPGTTCDSGATQSLTGDMATCSLAGGLEHVNSPFTVTATYQGDSNFFTSTGTATQNVQKDGVTIGVTSSEMTLVTGQPVTFTASVLTVASPGQGTPTGQMVFSVVGADGGAVTCDGGDTQSLSGSTWACSFAAGELSGRALSYTVTATLDDPNFNSPVAGSLTEAIGRASTTTTLSKLQGSYYAAQAISFRVTIATNAPATRSPGGFLEWAFCPSPLTGNCTGYPGGTVVLPTPRPFEVANNENGITITVPGGLKPGDYTLNATYEGDPEMGASTVGTHVLVVEVPTSVTVFLNHNPTVNGGRLIIRAAVTANSKATDQLGAPSGTITFNVTGSSMDTITCGTSGSGVVDVSTNSSNQGVAKCVVFPVMSTDSPYQIQAVYSGDSNYDGSSSATYIATVTP